MSIYIDPKTIRKVLEELYPKNGVKTDPESDQKAKETFEQKQVHSRIAPEISREIVEQTFTESKANDSKLESRSGSQGGKG